MLGCCVSSSVLMLRRARSPGARLGRKPSRRFRNRWRSGSVAPTAKLGKRAVQTAPPASPAGARARAVCGVRLRSCRRAVSGRDLPLGGVLVAPLYSRWGRGAGDRRVSRVQGGAGAAARRVGAWRGGRRCKLATRPWPPSQRFERAEASAWEAARHAGPSAAWRCVAGAFGACAAGAVVLWLGTGCRVRTSLDKDR